VEIRNSVGESGAQVEKRQSGSSSHPAIAIGSAGADALEQAENCANPVHPIERRDEGHLRSAWICKTELYTRRRGGFEHADGCIHRFLRGE
jgi:hypothetical protein